MNEDSDIQQALAGMHVVEIDVDTDHGKTVREQFKATGYPTFLLLDSNGETIDRWMGYGKPQAFIDQLAASSADMRTVAEKATAFEVEPSLALAEVLGRTAEGEGRFGDAVGYYKQAQTMDPDGAHAFNYAIFEATARGARTGAFMPGQIQEAARVVMEDPRRTLDEVADVAYVMSRVADVMGVPKLMQPYLEQAMTELKDSEDEGLQKRRTDMALLHAVKIEGDMDKALGIKRGAMPAGWQQDADQLNNFAWWCFENDTNLDEAMALATTAVDLAGDDAQKANILDTLAEICNARGDCAEAIDLMKQAIALDPGKEYFKEQLARFEKLQAGS